MEQYRPETVYSDLPQVPRLPATASLQPTDRVPGALLLENYRSEPVGSWAGNRGKQAEHYRGIIFIAIRAVCNLAGGATYQVYRKAKKVKPKTTFGPNVVAKSVASPQATGRDEDYLPFDDEEHPLCKILSRPNPHETFGELSSKLVLQNRLTGVGPLWAVPNEKNRPVELWALKTPLLFPIWQRTKQYPNGAWRVLTSFGQQGWSSAFSSGSSMAAATLPGEEVKRWMEPHPWIDWDGFSPLDGGAMQLDCLESIDEARKTSMDEGVVLGTYIMAPGASQDELDRLVKEMKQKQGGSKGHRKFAAFAFGTPESKGTIQSDTQAPVDMEYESGWEQLTGFCLALFGVPKIVAGLDNADTYASGFAARQQFHDEQTNYLESLATFYTKNLAWPWCSFDGEYLIRAKPRPINDHELAEKKLSRACQYDTILYNEVRAKDDLPPVPEGDVPVSVYIAKLQQEIAPPPVQPGMDPNAIDPTAMGADPNDPSAQDEEQGPTDAAGLMDEVTQEALGILGVPAEGEEQNEQQVGQPVMKAAGQSGIFKDSRGHRYKLENGKRVPIGDTGGISSERAGRQAGGVPGSSTAGQRRGYSSGPAKPMNLLDPQGRVHKITDQASLGRFVEAGGKVPEGMSGDLNEPSNAWKNPVTTPPPLPQQGRPKPPPLPPASYPTPPATRQEHQQRVQQSAPRVAQMAGQIPDGADVLAKAGQWAARAADQHADRVAAHLGVSREEAHHLIRTTIEHLCHVAAGINKTGASQKTVRGASGKKLTFKVGGGGKQTQSGATKQSNARGASGPSRPANPASRGSLPPRPAVVKAVEVMSGLDGSAGGFLVPERSGRRKRKRKMVRRRAEREAANVLKGL
jgi:portal protein